MRLVDALRGPIWQRLAKKLYLLALASFAVSVATPVAIAWLSAPPIPDFARPFPEDLEPLRAALDEPDARQRALDRIERERHLRLAVYDDAGARVASATGSVAPRSMPQPPRGPHARGGFGPPFMVPMTSPSGHSYSIAPETQGPPDLLSKLVVSLAVVLALLLLATVFLAATLAVPLAELARATSAFGSGDLAARADVSRAGAFSSLAQTFNQMAERVTSLMRSERELLANVSHELRTPLARIRVALDIAEVKNAPIEKKSLAGIERDLKELETIVDDVLTAARLEAIVGNPVLALRAQPVRIRDLVESSAESFRLRYPRHRLELRVDADGTAHLDTVLARRALDNLFDNAGKYSDFDSVVTVDAGVEGDAAVIVVKDEGIGISEEDQSHLFTPFFRGEKSRDRRTGGVGLGLALVRRIALAHGGDVTVSSELGRGTTVRLRFLLTKPAAVA